MPLAAQQAQEKVDYEAIYKIKDEGFQRSQVMEIMSWLTDVYGPRLTNSPGFRKAGEWAVKEMTSWGLANVEARTVRVRSAAAGRTTSSTLQATTPGGSFPLIGMSTAWTPGTNGLVSGDAVLAVIETPEDLAKYKGKLKGKFVLTTATARRAAAVDAARLALHRRAARRDSKRETDAAPAAGAAADAPAAPDAPAAAGGGRGAAPELRRSSARSSSRTKASLALIIAGRGDGGTIFLGGNSANRAAERHRPRPAADRHRRSSTTAASSARSRRTCRSRSKLDIKNTFHDDPQSFNVVARDPGHRQGRRGRDARRALRLVARRHRRDRQRRGLGGDDGGDADPKAERRASCAARCGIGAVGRRGAGAARARAPT